MLGQKLLFNNGKPTKTKLFPRDESLFYVVLLHWHFGWLVLPGMADRFEEHCRKTGRKTASKEIIEELILDKPWPGKAMEQSEHLADTQLWDILQGAKESLGVMEQRPKSRALTLRLDDNPQLISDSNNMKTRPNTAAPAPTFKQTHGDLTMMLYNKTRPKTGARSNSLPSNTLYSKPPNKQVCKWLQLCFR